MEPFNLSPGITPVLTDATLLGYVLIPYLGYLLADRRGLLAGFAAVSAAVAVIKLLTDWSDAPDVVAALAALVAPLLWAGLELGRIPRGRALRVVLALLGIGAIAVGLIKSRDFYDPFDLFLTTSAVLGGAGVLVRLVRGPRASPGDPPRAAAS